jgi:hypothetical protein
MPTRPPLPETRDWRVWLAALLVWLLPATLLSTQQWAQLRDTPKEMSWVQAFGYQGVSWMLLVPVTPLLLSAIRARPLGRGAPGRFAAHMGASILFGAVFLGVAVPTRHLFHPSPIRWTVFGEAFYKSAPQFIAIGAAAYWLIVLVGSLLEARGRAAALSVELEDARTPASVRVTLKSVAGLVAVSVREIVWIESASVGARVYTDGETHLVRHTLADLMDRLQEHGFTRIHRSRLVNTARVREVVGGKGRDATARLDTGQTIRISRRMRGELDQAISGPAS